MEIPDCLELRPSPIHGQGVFAKEDIAAGTCIGFFTGEDMNHQEFKARYGNDLRYTYRDRRNWTYIVAKENRNFITYINDGVHGQENPCVNVALCATRLIALVSIKAGEELLLQYPRDYWHKNCEAKSDKKKVQVI